MSDRSKPHSDPRFAPYVQRVRERLEAQEGWCELRQLAHLSAAELELLVRMERGWGPLDPQFPHPHADQQFPQTRPLGEGCTPIRLQVPRGTVAFMRNDADEIRVAS